MRNLLKALKDNLLIVYQLSIWLCGLVSPLVFMPAGFSIHFDDKMVKGIAALLVTLLVGACYLFLPPGKSLLRSRTYIILAAATLFLGIISLFIDLHLDKLFTVEMPAGSGQYVIIGTRVQDGVASRFRQRGRDVERMTPKDIVSNDPTDPVDQIYFEGDIDHNAYLLVGAYYVVLLFFVLSLILISYALFTHPSQE